MMTAIFIFTLGSLVCGLAVSMNTLIAARVLQGRLGGGGIMVSLFSINADLFEPRVRRALSELFQPGADGLRRDRADARRRTVGSVRLALDLPRQFCQSALRC